MLRASAKVRIVAIALLIFLFGIGSNDAMATDDEICDVTADVALGREDYLRAIASHLRLLQSQPNNALAHYHLGFAYGMVGRVQEELAEYQASARLGLKNWDLFLNLGLAYFGQRQLAPAAEALATAVRLGPEHDEAHYNLAIVYESENRLGEALREITAARRLAPKDPDAANFNAIICVEMGDIGGARDIWTSLAHFAPDYAPAYENLTILNCSLVRNSQFNWRIEFSDSRSIR
jgi:tetratricopeptide (TPR) repeat protein